MKKNTLLAILLLFMNVFVLGQGYIEMANLIATDATVDDQFGYAVDHTETDVIFGAPHQDTDADGNNILNNAGAVYIYSLSGLAQKIVPSDRSGGDQFGICVAIDGDYAVIGTQPFSAYNKRVFVFKRNTLGIWEEDQILTNPATSSLNQFGVSVAISNETILIGDPGDDFDENGLNTVENAGAVYVFDLDNISEDWVETYKIVPPNRYLSKGLGRSVDIDGDNLVIGTHSDRYDANESNPFLLSGSCYIYNRNSLGIWSQKQKVVASDRVIGQLFGFDVGISGDNIIVGASGEKRDSDGNNPLNNAGAAYTFSYDAVADEWNENQKVVAQTRGAFTAFGRSVDIDNDRIVASSYVGPNAGVELYLDSGFGDWTFSQKLVPSDFQGSDFFGWDVSVTESFIMAGSVTNDIIDYGGVAVDNAGSGYVFYNLPCTLPTITNAEVTVDCSSGQATVSIDGNLNTPSNSWSVYSGDCNGTLIATSISNNFTISLPSGTTAISIRGEDGPGCVNEDAGICFNLTVPPPSDVTPPVAICQDITVYLDNTGSASIVASDIDGGSYDNCSSVGLAAAPLNFDCDDLGTNSMVLQVWDNNGYKSACNANVTVVDNIDLVVACQDITISLDAIGNASITEADIDGGTYANCGDVFMAAAPKNFDASNIGDNTVWLQVWTNDGQSGYCTANVHVVNPSPLMSNGNIDLFSITPEKQTANTVQNENTQIITNRGEVILFPNPVVSEFTIQSNDQSLIQNITIMNSNFSKVQAFEFTSQEDKERINIEDLPGGIYFVVINYKNGTEVKKIIKI